MELKKTSTLSQSEKNFRLNSFSRNYSIKPAHKNNGTEKKLSKYHTIMYADDDIHKNHKTKI